MNLLSRTNMQGPGLHSIYIGKRLGFYSIIHQQGFADARHLAVRCHQCPDYILEWLEEQVERGILSRRLSTRSAMYHQYCIPYNHQYLLVEDDYWLMDRLFAALAKDKSLMKEGAPMALVNA